MQLIMLLRELDFKYFGQDAVFRPLLNDLKKLKTTGVPVENKFVQGHVSMGLLPCFLVTTWVVIALVVFLKILVLVFMYVDFAS